MQKTTWTWITSDKNSILMTPASVCWQTYLLTNIVAGTSISGGQMAVSCYHLITIHIDKSKSSGRQDPQDEPCGTQLGKPIHEEKSVLSISHLETTLFIIIVTILVFNSEIKYFVYKAIVCQFKNSISNVVAIINN